MPAQICYSTLFGTCLKMQPFHQPLFNGCLNSFGILFVSAKDFKIICIPHKVHLFQVRFLQRRTSISVSYTHLDVYKRQPTGSEVKNASICWTLYGTRSIKEDLPICRILSTRLSSSSMVSAYTVTKSWRKNIF